MRKLNLKKFKLSLPRGLVFRAQSLFILCLRRWKLLAITTTKKIVKKEVYPVNFQQLCTQKEFRNTACPVPVNKCQKMEKEKLEQVRFCLLNLFFSSENLDILYITKIFVSRICTNCQILTQKRAKKKKPSKITALYHFWN